jgi:hypothetical protein
VYRSEKRQKALGRLGCVAVVLFVIAFWAAVFALAYEYIEYIL